MGKLAPTTLPRTRCSGARNVHESVRQTCPHPRHTSTVNTCSAPLAVPCIDRQLQALFKRLTEIEEAISILKTAGVVLSNAKRSVADMEDADSTVAKCSVRVPTVSRPPRNCQENTLPTSENALTGGWDSQDAMQYQSAHTSEGETESTKPKHHYRVNRITDTPTPEEVYGDATSGSSAVRGRLASSRAPGSNRALFGSKRGTGSPRSPREDKDGAIASLLILIDENAFKREMDLESLESSESASTTM